MSTTASVSKKKPLELPPPKTTLRRQKSDEPFREISNKAKHRRSLSIPKDTKFAATNRYTSHSNQLIHYPSGNIYNLIGSGAFGKVFQPKPTDTNPNPDVLKVIPKGNLKPTEIEILKQLRNHHHLNICGPKNMKNILVNGTPNTMIRFPYAGTPIKVACGRQLKIKFIHRFISNMSDGLVFLRHQHIAHRDIKPDNICFNGQIFQIIDFGLSVQVPETQQIPRKFCGTPTYFPPEYLTEQTINPYLVDRYAFGQTLSKLLLNRTSHEEELKHEFKSKTKAISPIEKRKLFIKELLRRRQSPYMIDETLLMHLSESASCRKILVRLISGLSHPNPSERLSLETAKSESEELPKSEEQMLALRMRSLLMRARQAGIKAAALQKE